MIEEQDAKGLATLPGIGPATAERVIAKLRRRVPKFALLVGRDLPADRRNRTRPALTEAFEVLRPWATATPTPAGSSTTPSTRSKSTKTSTRCCTPSTKNPTADSNKLAIARIVLDRIAGIWSTPKSFSGDAVITLRRLTGFNLQWTANRNLHSSHRA